MNSIHAATASPVFSPNRGFRAGDRLCVYLVNSPEMIDIYLACVKLGVIFVPINILYRDREISHILADAAPRALVSDARVETDLPLWKPADLSRDAAAMEDIRPEVHLDGDAPAGIIYTSGTTGTSKGAVLTHNNFAANAVNLLACWKISAEDRFLLALPLFHVHGLGNGLHCWLMSGCRMRLLERFEHRTAAAEFLDFRPTLFFGVPTIYVRLLAIEPATAREIGGFMRLFVSGSAPLPAQVLEEFRELFGHTILERYGMSETMMNHQQPLRGRAARRDVGFPLPGVSVRLLNPDLQPVPYGETGEIYLRGPNVFAGYWRREEATREAFVDGYFKTGDLATRSPDGYFTLTGRKSDLIISGGFNIYPREIEEFLAGAARDRRGRGSRACRTACAAKCRWRTSSPPGRFDATEIESPLPRETGFVQSPAGFHHCRETAAQRDGKDPETPLYRSAHHNNRRRFCRNRL